MSTAASTSLGNVGRRFFDTALLIAGAFVLWQMVHQFAGETALSSPAATLARAYRLVSTTMFWEHVRLTMSAYLVALIIAIGGGLIMGLSFGSRRLLGDVAEPGLMAFYTVPKVAFFPIILLVFGIGLSAEVAFGVIHGIVPVVIFTMNAVRNVKPVFIKAARIMRLNQARVWWHIVIPSALPEIFTGIRVGASLTFIGTILSEMFGSHAGIGFLLMNAIGSNNGELILALTLLIMVFAITLSSILVAIDNRLHARV